MNCGSERFEKAAAPEGMRGGRDCPLAIPGLLSAYERLWSVGCQLALSSCLINTYLCEMMTRETNEDV